MGKVYEIRIYSTNILGSLEFRKMADNEAFWQLRTKFSNVIGSWRTELNGLFEFIHIAEFDDLDHLFRVREEMSGSEEWLKSLAPIFDIKMAFTNRLVTPVDGSEVNTDFKHSKTAVYEFQTVPEGTKVPSIAANATLVGRFSTVYGTSKTEYRLIRYPDSTTAFSDALRSNKDLPAGASNRLMVPLSVSAVH